MPLRGERIRSRHPFQLFMLIVSFVYSLPGLAFSAVRPGSVQETVGPVGTIVWSAGLAVGTGCALLGIFGYRANRATGLSLEEFGLLVAGVATLYYAGVALWALGWAAFFSAVVMVGYGSACIVRSAQLHRLLGRTVRELAAGSDR